MLQPKVTLYKGKPQPGGTVIASTSSGVDYTPANAKARLARKTNDYLGSETEGVKVDKSGQSTAKPFTRKVIVSKGGHTRIVGNDGKIIKEGEAHTKEIQDAVKASEKKADITNEQRIRNARAGNLVGGTAKDITRQEVNDLAKAKQATADQLLKDETPEIIAAKEKEKSIHQLTEDRVKARNALKVKIKK
jgi:hypothetical protein